MDTKRPVGRPPTPKNPIDLATEEVVRWIQLTKRTRELLEHQLKGFGNDLDRPDLSVAGRIEILGALRDIAIVALRNVESGIKLVNSGVQPSETTSPDDIMKELLQ